MIFITISTVGLGDYTMSDDTLGSVVLQFVLFLPGLALFAEFINLGNAASAETTENVARVSGTLQKTLSASSTKPTATKASVQAWGSGRKGAATAPEPLE